MSGLILKLAPRERIIINGAVIENGDRRSRLTVITPSARILRLRDSIHPDHVNSPVQRCCYIAQLGLSGDAPVEDVIEQLSRATLVLEVLLADSASRQVLSNLRDCLLRADLYPALKALRSLLPMEEQLMAAAQA